MTVIAMTREMGSRGREVALGVSEELGVRIVQHEVVEHVAERMNLRESSVNHLLEGTDSLFERWGIDRSDLSLFTREEIIETAQGGNVLFRGWGAVPVLRPVSHVVCVRICASENSRVREVMRRIGIEDDLAARKEVRRNDAAHDRVSRQVFNNDWRDPVGYDLVLNTDRVAIRDCVDAIVELTRTPSFETTAASLSKLNRMKLQASIKRALREHEVTRRANPSFEAELEPDTTRVVLSGVVLNHRFSQTASEVVAAVPGVSEVVDNTVVPASTGQFGP